MVLLLPAHQPQLVHEQDDESISSTLTVERLNCAKQYQDAQEFTSQQQGRKQGKHVSFNMSANVEYPNKAMTADECKDLWYRVKDYKVFRAVALDSAQQIIRIEARNRAPYSYQRVMEMTYGACCQAYDDNDQVVPPSELVHLQRWLEVATSRCGLEKWAIRRIGRDKSHRRDEIADTVLQLQKVCNNEKNCHSDEFIRSSSAAISRPSRLFARIMAQALAAAIQKEDQQENAAAAAAQQQQQQLQEQQQQQQQ